MGGLGDMCWLGMLVVPPGSPTPPFPTHHAAPQHTNPKSNSQHARTPHMPHTTRYWRALVSPLAGIGGKREEDDGTTGVGTLYDNGRRPRDLIAIQTWTGPRRSPSPSWGGTSVPLPPRAAA